MRFLKTEDEKGDRIQALEDRMARDANPERRWEYHVLRVGPKARAEHQLNELGAKGWQLVQAIETEGHLAFYLERELPPSEEPAAEEQVPNEADESGPDTFGP
jgi:hypothetical protein